MKVAIYVTVSPQHQTTENQLIDLIFYGIDILLNEFEIITRNNLLFSHSKRYDISLWIKKKY